MPASKLTSTATASISIEYLVADSPSSEPVNDSTPLIFDPAALAKILRQMSKLERELFASGLTQPQQRLLSQLSHCRAPIWQMVPEGL